MRRTGALFAMGACGTLVGVLVAVSQPVLYRAVCIVDLAAALPQQAATWDARSREEWYRTQQQLVTSADVLGAAARKLALTRTSVAPPRSTACSTATSREESEPWLKQTATVSREEHASLLSVSVDAPEPCLADELANSIAQAYVAWRRLPADKRAARKAIDVEIGAREETLARVDRELEELVRTISQGSDGRTVAAEIAALEEELTAARIRRIETAAALQSVLEASRVRDPLAARAPALDRDEQVRKLREERAAIGLRSLSRGEKPSEPLASSRELSLRTRMSERIAAIARSARTRLAETDTLLHELQDRLDAARKKTTAVQHLEPARQRLERARSDAQLELRVLREWTDSENGASSTRGDDGIVRPPKSPPASVPRPVLSFAITGAICGVTTAICWLLGRRGHCRNRTRQVGRRWPTMTQR